MEQQAQNYANHKRIIPLFHMAIFGIFAVWFAQSAYVIVTDFTVDHLFRLALAAALILLLFFVRIFPLTVQDRVIRLEMTLRLERLLTPDLRSRIHELEVGQLVALRFASDKELPALVKAVFDEKLTDREEIKKRIQEWRPDNLRV